MKQPPQRRESFDACPEPSGPATRHRPDRSPEEPLKGKEEPRGPESEGESGGPKSEPTTPKAGRASLVAPGRSPKAAGSRTEKCAGVHISGPFSVTVPFHITSNLSRLTRGLPCPALAQAGTEPPTATLTPTPRFPRDPEPSAGEQQPPGAAGAGPPGPRRAQPPPSPSVGDAEGTRLSLELRDSFAFLDSPETWLEIGGDAEPVTRSPPMDTGASEGFLAMEEGLESGCMNVSRGGSRGQGWGGGNRDGDGRGRVGTKGTGTEMERARMGMAGPGWT